jgi:hypothetical protein
VAAIGEKAKKEVIQEKTVNEFGSYDLVQESKREHHSETFDTK